MSGADIAVQIAIRDHLQSDPNVQAVFGSQPRIELDSGEERPAHPFIRFVSHRVTQNGGTNVIAEDHQIDLAIYTRWGGRAAGREAVQTLRNVLENVSLSPDGHNWIWSHIAFSDTLMLRDMATMKSVIRLRVRTQPIT
jgi:hypothetical protein